MVLLMRGLERLNLHNAEALGTEGVIQIWVEIGFEKTSGRKLDLHRTHFCDQSSLSYHAALITCEKSRSACV